MNKAETWLRTRGVLEQVIGGVKGGEVRTYNLTTLLEDYKRSNTAMDDFLEQYEAQKAKEEALRDEFAGEAMIALISTYDSSIPPAMVAEDAYKYADAMLDARKK